MSGIVKLSDDGKVVKYVLEEDALHITIPEGAEVIGERAFVDCKALKSAEIPEGVTKIGKWAFYDCESLQSINIPESVTKMGEMIFHWCILLERIDMYSRNIEELDLDADVLGAATEDCVIYVPAGMKQAYSQLPAFYYAQIMERENLWTIV